MRRALSSAAAAVFLGLCGASVGQAHKPITSPYTFAEHAGPIFRNHCGSCHAPDSVAPMSLLTHEDTAPWAESIRLELMAGHMPPWGSIAPSKRFRGSQMTGTELNTLLVWSAGGTPAGTPAGPPPPAVTRDWRLGNPDAIIEAAAPVTIPADVQELTEVFTLPTSFDRDRLLRAIDLRPAAPAIVRGATITVGASSESGSAAPSPERLLALWLPGDEPTRLDEGTALDLPKGASLVVTVRYHKSWRNEREALTDRPAVGLYFAPEGASLVQAFALAADGQADAKGGTSSRTLDRDLSMVAVYPDATMSGMVATVHARRPGGDRELLFSLRPRDGWARRYWLREPVTLPRGTQLDITFAPNEDAALLPPGMTARAAAETTRMRLTLNGILR
jgi:hypothetical protein